MTKDKKAKSVFVWWSKEILASLSLKLFSEGYGSWLRYWRT